MISSRSPQLGKQLNEFDKALVTAAYFGFMPIVAPKITKQDTELTQGLGNHPHYDATEKIAVIRTYLEQNLASLSHPIALVYEKSASRKRRAGFALHFIGSYSGIAEAIVIQTALSILSDEGYKDLKIDINCVGDKESINAYERELSSYVRKSNSNLSEELKEKIREDVFNLFKLKTPETLLLCEMAPSSITFLSAPSRVYFKEVLEYIETLGIEFRLTPELVGERDHTSHTIFAIKNKKIESESGEALAVGYRYSRLGRCLGLRKEIPMVGVNIFPAFSKKVKRRIYKRLPKPKFYLIQLGQEAKIKTLFLIELLRANHIPLHHFLGKDKLTAQLSNAENLRVPYLIIIGQKEALDNTVIVRNVSTRAQDTVNIPDLPYYLKKITL